MQKDIDMIDRYLFDLYAPNEFNVKSKNNVLRDLDNTFQDICSTLEEAGVKEPKNLSVYEFNQRIIYFEKKNPSKNH